MPRLQMRVQLTVVAGVAAAARVLVVAAAARVLVVASARVLVVAAAAAAAAARVLVVPGDAVGAAALLRVATERCRFPPRPPALLLLPLPSLMLPLDGPRPARGVLLESRQVARR